MMTSDMVLLSELATQFECELVGDDSKSVTGLAPLDLANSSQISFLVNPIYRQEALQSNAGVLIVNSDDYVFLSTSANVKERSYLISKNPYACFARIAQFFEKRTIGKLIGGIHPSASIAKNVQIPNSCSIGPNCTLSEGVILGEGVSLVGHVFLGKNVKIGSNSTIHPMTAIYHDCEIGARAIIHGGVIIGSDGFGFAPDFSATGGEWVKIPQTGRVLIGDDVELGASCTLDRGAMADTIIGNGCKFDNQVQIGHNVRIGDFTVMAGCSGVAGSTEIGSLCVIGGFSNFSGHLKIADRTTVSGGTSITKSISETGQHFTSVFPFTKHSQWEKNAAIIRGLDKMRVQIKELSKIIQGKKSS